MARPRQRRVPAPPREAHEAQHVVLRDPPTRPGPGHLREIDPVLGRQLPHQRRQDLRPRPPIGWRLDRLRRGSDLRRHRLRGPSGRRRSGRSGAASGWCRGGGGIGATRRLRTGLSGRGALRSELRRSPRSPGATRPTLRRSRPARCPTATVSPSATRIFVERPRRRRRHLGVDLVGRDLEQRLVERDLVALLLEPLQDRSLDDGLAELRHLHGGHPGLQVHQADSLRTASSMSDTCGRYASSSGGENGTGTWGGVSRTTGASSDSNASSAISDATSAPRRQVPLALVEHDRPARLGDGREDRLLVERLHRSQVEHLDRRYPRSRGSRPPRARGAPSSRARSPRRRCPRA